MAKDEELEQYRSRVDELQRQKELRTEEFEQQVSLPFSSARSLNRALLLQIEALGMTNELLKKEFEASNDNNNNNSSVQELNELQQTHQDLLSKQAELQQKYDDEKKTHERILKDKVMECEMKMAMMKSRTEERREH